MRSGFIEAIRYPLELNHASNNIMRSRTVEHNAIADNPEIMDGAVTHKRCFAGVIVGPYL